MGGRMGHSLSMSRVRVSKATPTVDPSQVYRLEDMDVEEVSMVDRAANKKKFIVVKREGDSMATEVQPNGKGGFTSGGGTSKAGAPPPPPAAAAPPGKDPKKKPAPPGAPAAKAGGKMEVPPGFKEAVAPLLDKAMEAIQALDESVDSATPAEMGDDGDMPGVPADFINGVTAVMNLLDRAQNMWPAAPEEPDGDAGTTDDPADASGEAAGAGASQPSEMTMRLALRNIEKAFASKKLEKQLVQKLGAKMSKDRLTRLQQAVGVLSNLVNEVAGQVATPPTGAPPVGKNGTKKNDNPFSTLEAQVAHLATEVGKIAKVVVEDHKTIETIKKTRSAPASGPVETTDGGSSQNDQPVSWPLDMNKPITRDSVGKSESFFDD